MAMSSSSSRAAEGSASREKLYEWAVQINMEQGVCRGEDRRSMLFKGICSPCCASRVGSDAMYRVPTEKIGFVGTASMPSAAESFENGL
jgi:hypothetical protein